MHYSSVSCGIHSVIMKHDSTECDRQLVDYLKDVIEQQSRNVDFDVRVDDFEIFCTVASGAALITVSANEIPITTSALMTGQNKDEDDSVLEGMWQITEDMYKQFTLTQDSKRSDLGVTDRPLIVTSMLPTCVDQEKTIGIVAQLEMHFAAAFFEWSNGDSDLKARGGKVER